MEFNKIELPLLEIKNKYKKSARDFASYIIEELSNDNDYSKLNREIFSKLEQLIYLFYKDHFNQWWDIAFNESVMKYENKNITSFDINLVSEKKIKELLGNAYYAIKISILILLDLTHAQTDKIMENIIRFEQRFPFYIGKWMCEAFDKNNEE